MQLDELFKKYKPFFEGNGRYITPQEFYQDLILMANFYRTKGGESEKDFPRTEGS